MYIVRGHLSAIFLNRSAYYDHVCIYFVVRSTKESHTNYKRRQFVDLLRSYGAKKKLYLITACCKTNFFAKVLEHVRKFIEHKAENVQCNLKWQNGLSLKFVNKTL